LVLLFSVVSAVSQENYYRQEYNKDVSNDYVELPIPERARYIRYKNFHVLTPYLSISGLNIFGKGNGKAPGAVKEFEVKRQEDRRDAMITGEAQRGAQGYNIFWGLL
jgi:hypothetical protein